MSIAINLRNKNVFISGAGGDIGFSILLKFLKAGAKCYCLDKELGNIKKILKLKKYKSKIHFIKKNLEDKYFLNVLKKNLKKIKIDTLINVSGFTKSENFLKYNLNDWDKTIKINLTAPFLLSKYLSKNFMRTNGSIINITSLASEQGFPNNVAYVASKGGLKQLTKAMAVDLEDKKIRVNSIGPGYIKTNMTKKSWINKKKRKNRSDRMISYRWGIPEDIANAALFLGSDLSSYINGQDLYVDGGWLSKGLKKDA